jgi:hypothetical protein
MLALPNEFCRNRVAPERVACPPGLGRLFPTPGAGGFCGNLFPPCLRNGLQTALTGLGGQGLALLWREQLHAALPRATAPGCLPSAIMLNDVRLGFINALLAG